MNRIIKMTELFKAVVDREMGKLEKDGLVSISGDHTGKISIHVMPEYFDEHFSNFEVKEDDWVHHGKVKVSFETDSGNEIFCLREVEYKRVG